MDSAWAAADGVMTVAEFESATATANFVGSVAGGFAAGGIQGGNIQSAVQGAVFASLNFGIGSFTAALPGSDLGRYATNVGLHAALGCGQQAAAGGSCRAGALAGGFSAATGPFVVGPPPAKLVAVAVIGGVASKLGGGRFENGAMTAAFAYLFNELAHETTAAQRGYEATFYPDGTVCYTSCSNWSGAVETVCPECYVGGYASGAILRRSYVTAVESLDALGESEMATQLGSETIVAARNAIKDVFRGPFSTLLEGWHQPSAGDLFLQKGSWEAVQQGALRTNEFVNRLFLIWK